LVVLIRLTVSVQVIDWKDCLQNDLDVLMVMLNPTHSICIKYRSTIYCKMLRLQTLTQLIKHYI